MHFGNCIGSCTLWNERPIVVGPFICSYISLVNIEFMFAKYLAITLKLKMVLMELLFYLNFELKYLDFKSQQILTIHLILITMTFYLPTLWFICLMTSLTNISHVNNADARNFSFFTNMTRCWANVSEGNLIY